MENISQIIWANSEDGMINGYVMSEGLIPVNPMKISNEDTLNIKIRYFRGLGFLSRFQNGVPKGHFYIGMIGGGALLGHFEGRKKVIEAFIYPDFSTAIIGTFDGNKLVKGRGTSILG